MGSCSDSGKTVVQVELDELKSHLNKESHSCD